MSASDGGDGDTFQEGPGGSQIVVIENSLPGWVQDLRPLADEGPVTFIQRVIVDFILGGAAAIIFTLVGGIETAFQSFILAFGDAGRAFLDAFSVPASVAIGLITDLNGLVVGLAAGLGLPGDLVLPILYVVELALVFRAAPPALAATADVAGSIPVVGGALSGAYTFVSGYLGGIFDDG